MTTPSPEAGIEEATRERILLWFFRELTDEQRQTLYRIVGLVPAGEAIESHIIQRRTVDALFSRYRRVSPACPEAGVSDERLREIIAGTEGVTPGPWLNVNSIDQLEMLRCMVRQVDSDPTDKHHWPFCVAQTVMGQFANADKANFDHIARLDPDTVKSIAQELLDRRASPRSDAGQEAVALTAEQIRIVKNIKWASADRDNMEFTTRVSCYQRDALDILVRALLAESETK